MCATAMKIVGRTIIDEIQSFPVFLFLTWQCTDLLLLCFPHSHTHFRIKYHLKTEERQRHIKYACCLVMSIYFNINVVINEFRKQIIC